MVRVQQHIQIHTTIIPGKWRIKVICSRGHRIVSPETIQICSCAKAPEGELCWVHFGSWLCEAVCTG